MADMHPLGALITQRMEANGWSLDDVVERATRRGEKLGRSNLDRMKKSPPEYDDPLCDPRAGGRPGRHATVGS